MTPICPCGALVHAATPFNPPGLTVIRYRAGDYSSFRESMLLPLPGEIELGLWKPGANQDIAVQIVEWWAVLADILTFYNEQIVNGQYLRTATLPETVDGIVRLLGYRPRPGVGAVGIIAALAKGPNSVVVPAAYQVGSKPGPGQTPQVFETDTAVTAALPGEAQADAPASETVTTSILLAGEGQAIKAGDKLLLMNKGWAAKTTDFAAVLIVKALKQEKDPRGRKNTRVEFETSVNTTFGATSLRLMRSEQSTGVWPYNAMGYVTATQIHLASVTRQLQPGNPVVLDVMTSPSWTYFLSVTGNTEVVWFANPPDVNAPHEGPDPDDDVPIPIPHSALTFTGEIDTSTITGNRSAVQVRFAWQDAGTPIATPAITASGASMTLTSASFPPVTLGQQVLIEDRLGKGALASVTATGSAGATQLVLGSIPPLAQPLEAPLRVLFNLASVSRGKTVANEILGSGNATQAGQEFALEKSPLTYLPGTAEGFTEPYRSTLRVWVNGIEWKEVPTFYDQPADAKIFVTREDVEAKTYVQFGDGVNGARLPSGVNNVVASYRQESGAAIPDAGKLNVMLKPLAGLKALVSPVQPRVGSDPDSPDCLRALAPRSVLTFGRAVSGADYEAIAAQAPGVARAKAYWSFDAARQQTLVTVYVGDTSGAVDAARTALAGATDPNKPLLVQQASAVPIILSLAVAVDPSFQSADVIAAVKFALSDAATGLLGSERVRIGQMLFRSQIFEACMRVPGVIAVHNLTIIRKSLVLPFFQGVYRFFAGEGKFFQLALEDTSVTAEGA